MRDVGVCVGGRGGMGSVCGKRESVCVCVSHAVCVSEVCVFALVGGGERTWGEVPQRGGGPQQVSVQRQVPYGRPPSCRAQRPRFLSSRQRPRCSRWGEMWREKDDMTWQVRQCHVIMQTVLHHLFGCAPATALGDDPAFAAAASGSMSWATSSISWPCRGLGYLGSYTVPLPARPAGRWAPHAGRGKFPLRERARL